MRNSRRIGVPVRTVPRLALRQPSEAHLHPVLLDQRQVLQQTGECQFGGCVLLDHLRLGQPAGLRQHGLALVVEILPEQGGFRASRVRIDSHTLMLAVSAGSCVAAGSPRDGRVPHDRDRGGQPGDCRSARDRERAQRRDQPQGAAPLCAALLSTPRTGLSVLDAAMAPARGEMRIFGMA